MFVNLAHLTGWESCVWECVILQNRGLVLAGTILILRTQMLPNLLQCSHDRMSQLLLKLYIVSLTHSQHGTGKMKYMQLSFPAWHN